MHELGVTEQELVASRRDVDRLRDQLFEFSLAVEDIERDLGRRPSPAADEALAELLAVVRAYLSVSE
ncbi:MAG: hypothetical protein JJLCMIEE_00279 [Acidimicrobiales bacterium]|nr:MAG: hypothetical protein EDR02_01665 [Actinomycetota bacterium]MBV6507238.1 hypothetical protein [Acidimicrobiales bacterium]RIK05480.1 MAG: hypothetical protein DCC48_09265 [Acidobacteriota bacterium]